MKAASFGFGSVDNCNFSGAVGSCDTAPQTVCSRLQFVLGLGIAEEQEIHEDCLEAIRTSSSRSWNSARIDGIQLFLGAPCGLRTFSLKGRIEFAGEAQ